MTNITPEVVVIVAKLIEQSHNYFSFNVVIAISRVDTVIVIGVINKCTKIIRAMIIKFFIPMS